MLKIVKLREDARIPERAYPTDSGLDLFNVDEFTLLIGERKLISTGISIELPENCEAQIRPRSGNAFNHGVTVLNSVGTIDNSYRGEIKVLLINHGYQPVTFKAQSKIAQMVIAKVEYPEIVEVDSIYTTERGAGGFGSTGI